MKLSGVILLPVLFRDVRVPVSLSPYCDRNDAVWREDSGLLTDKTTLLVKQLRFGDVIGSEEGYHTLGKIKCFGMA